MAIPTVASKRRRIALALKISIPQRAGPPPEESEGDLYRGVVLVLAASALAGIAIAFYGGRTHGLDVLFDAALTLLLALGVLAGVFVAMTRRKASMAQAITSDASAQAPAEPAVARDDSNGTPQPISAKIAASVAALRSWLIRGGSWLEKWVRDQGALRLIRFATAVAGVVGIVYILRLDLPVFLFSRVTAAIAAGACLVAAVLAATVAYYLSAVDSTRLPEAPWLHKGARVVAWIFVLSAVAVVMAWARQETAGRVVHFLILGVNAMLCWQLFTIRPLADEGPEVFPLHLGVITTLGNRANILASVLDSTEQQLGIDLRSTWALTVVRRSLEPLAMGLLFVAWFSTSLTVVGPEEQALIERLGVPVGGGPLMPGLHLHFPRPIDRVFRLPVQRIQTTTVGHEGQEEGGPENVLWARQHAANEYTLLLGNGRDLLTIDAAIQFRISDARAWRYHCQNPADALRAIGYRAVMRSTVNRTLSEALSQNVVTLTGSMRNMVQHDADALGLGIQVVAFTVGGMHPPVAVAQDYQSVVSAEIAKLTAVVEAQAYRNQTVPAAEAKVQMRKNGATAAGEHALGKAAGEAWSFRTLQSQYRAAPQEFFFRRRLETLENSLGGRYFVVIDSRFQRDGGELWLTP
jgi:regulator of protease activity HflC (stomatin/prohibitin superfamily)